MFDVIAGKYRLKYVLNEGGMGVIFVAKDETLDRLVAVKMMNDSVAASSDGAVRFEREAKALAKLGSLSSYAVQIFDYGTEKGVPYLVMELLAGEDLAARLRKVERFSLADTRRFASQLVSVIKKAHHLGIVHRDLKPANIFLARRDEDEAVKLLDFGAIKCLDPSQQLQHTEPLGTLPYMAPEQLQGEPVDFRTDLWGLAAVLFEMVTGERAFDAVNRLRLRDEICSGPAPRPSLFLPGMEPLDPFFEHAFAKSPADRYATVEEFGRAFATAARACSSPIAPGAAGESIVVPADAEIPSPPILDTTPRSSRGLRRGATTTSPLA